MDSHHTAGRPKRATSGVIVPLSRKPSNVLFLRKPCREWRSSRSVEEHCPVMQGLEGFVSKGLLFEKAI